MVQFDEFVTQYYNQFVEALATFDREPLKDILKVMDRLLETGGSLWVAGNGGSAAIANHTVCDMTKGTHVEQLPVLKSHSLACNIPMMTALSNDISYDDVFSRQLEYYLKPEDAVLLVSSSGNSTNVVKACEFANAQGNPTIAFVGFRGGRLKDIAAHHVWIPVENYGIVEDIHQSLMHVLSQYVRSRADNASSTP